MANLILLEVLLVYLLFTFYYLSGKDFMSPPTIMTAAFFLSTTFVVANAKEWNVDYSFKAVLIIVTGIIVFASTYGIVSQLRKKFPCTSYKVDNRLLKVSTTKVLIVIVIDAIVLLIYRRAIINLVHSTGYTGTNIQWQYRNMSGVEGSEYLSGSIRMLIRVIDATCYVFAYIFINNIVVFKDKLRNNVLYLIPVAIYIAKGLMGGGRQDILKIISFSIVSSYILMRQKLGWKIDISFKYIIVAILTVATVLPLFYFTLSFTGRNTTRTLFQVISTYVGGPIQAFNQYVQDPVSKGKYFGEESLTPVLNLLGSLKILDFHKTIHLEYRRLGITIGNIYTFFRRPLQDFGLIGMYVFTALISLFFSHFYEWKIKYQPLRHKQDLRVIVYSYLFYWIVMSSIEQYSMIFISLQTILILLLFYVTWKFCFNLRFDGRKIYILRAGDLL